MSCRFQIIEGNFDFKNEVAVIKISIDKRLILGDIGVTSRRNEDGVMGVGIDFPYCYLTTSSIPYLDPHLHEAVEKFIYDLVIANPFVCEAIGLKLSKDLN